jgi:hypothetical protein
MARKSLGPETSPAAGEPAVLPLEGVFDDWLEFQAQALATGLGQSIDLQQALWSNWAGFMRAWWQLPEAGLAAEPWLPFWLRGGEHLA